MRGKGFLLSLALLIAALGGCETTKQRIKPPVNPDDNKLPPVADQRYNSAPRFPQGTMNSTAAVRNRDRINLQEMNQMPMQSTQQTGFTN